MLCGELASLDGLDAVDIDLSRRLSSAAFLHRPQRIEHSYPHCWRCDHELIFYAVKEWFIRADSGPRPVASRTLLAHARQRTVKWVPEYAGKRMDDWLANMGDWCISRKRFWGLPLPIYMGDNGEVAVIGSRAELRARAVDPAQVDALPELHRPWIDEVEIFGKDGKSVLRRVPEVGDAWLDAGIVPFSTVGYNGATDLRMPAGCVGETPETYLCSRFPLRITSLKCASRCGCGFSRCCS